MSHTLVFAYGDKRVQFFKTCLYDSAPAFFLTNSKICFLRSYLEAPEQRPKTTVSLCFVFYVLAAQCKAVRSIKNLEAFFQDILFERFAFAKNALFVFSKKSRFQFLFLFYFKKTFHEDAEEKLGLPPGPGLP